MLWIYVSSLINCQVHLPSSFVCNVYRCIYIYNACGVHYHSIYCLLRTVVLQLTPDDQFYEVTNR